MKEKVAIVDEKDRNKGIVTAVFYAVIVSILLLFLSVTQPDPPLKDIPVEIELTPEMIMEPSSSGSNGGAEKAGSENPNPTPPDQGDPVLTSNKPKPVQHNSGQGGNRPVQNPNPPQQTPDPTFTFGGGGQNGVGGSGNGPLFGQGSGGGTNDGQGGDGNGNSRKVIKQPCKPDNMDEDGVVWLSLQIDESGRVIRADNVPSKSTTSSLTTINKVRQSVLDCMKFEPKPGAPVLRMAVPFTIKAN